MRNLYDYFNALPLIAGAALTYLAGREMVTEYVKSSTLGPLLAVCVFGFVGAAATTLLNPRR